MTRVYVTSMYDGPVGFVTFPFGYVVQLGPEHCLSAGTTIITTATGGHHGDRDRQPVGYHISL